MALESTLVPFVWPRTAAGCDQGPPSVEPRCSVQIRIRSDSTSGCRSEPYLPAMCTPISAWAPISCDDEDLQNWRCRTAGPRGMNQPEDKRQKPQIITSPNSRDDPLRIQPARCYHSAQTRPAPKAIQTRIEKSRELPPGGEVHPGTKNRKAAQLGSSAQSFPQAGPICAVFHDYGKKNFQTKS